MGGFVFVPKNSFLFWLIYSLASWYVRSDNYVNGLRRVENGASCVTVFVTGAFNDLPGPLELPPSPPCYWTSRRFVTLRQTNYSLLAIIDKKQISSLAFAAFHAYPQDLRKITYGSKRTHPLSSEILVRRPRIHDPFLPNLLWIQSYSSEKVSATTRGFERAKDCHVNSASSISQCNIFSSPGNGYV